MPVITNNGTNPLVIGNIDGQPGTLIQPGAAAEVPNWADLKDHKPTKNLLDTGVISKGGAVDDAGKQSQTAALADDGGTDTKTKTK